MSQVWRVRVDQRVSAVTGIEVPGFVFLRSSCDHVTRGGRTVWFVRLALKVVMQSDGDCVVVVLLYQSTRPHVQEYLNLHQQRCEDFRHRNIQSYEDSLPIVFYATA